VQLHTEQDDPFPLLFSSEYIFYRRKRSALLVILARVCVLLKGHYVLLSPLTGPSLPIQFFTMLQPLLLAADFSTT
jgi:hypothetical protein